MRQTSIQVYEAIRDQGLLSQRRFEVYDVIFHHGPLTAGEVWSEHLKEIAQIDSVRPRMAELEDRALIRTVGERTCRYSSRNCLTWDVTSQFPIEPPPKRTLPERHRALAKALGMSIDLLREQAPGTAELIVLLEQILEKNK